MANNNSACDSYVPKNKSGLPSLQTKDAQKKQTDNAYCFGRKAGKSSISDQSSNRLCPKTKSVASSDLLSDATNNLKKLKVSKPDKTDTLSKKKQAFRETATHPQSCDSPTRQPVPEEAGKNQELLIPLPGQGGYAIYMLAKSRPGEDQRLKLISHIKNELQSKNTIEFPAELLKKCNILPDSVKLVSSHNDSDSLPFLPVEGLECLNSLYRESYEEGLFQKIIGMAEKKFTDSGYKIEKTFCPAFHLVVSAEIIKIIESKLNNFVTEEQISVLKDHIIALKDILDEKIPAKFNLYEQLKTCGVKVTLNDKGDLTFEGTNIFTPFFSLSIHWLEHCLYLHDVFSTEFAKDLTNCISPLTKKLVEIGSGRGMLSAALKEETTILHHTSDINKQVMPWKGIRVYKKDAAEVLDSYKSQYKDVIYLCSWVTWTMFDAMVRTNIPFFLLMIGTRYLKKDGNLSDILKIYSDRVVKSVDLNIKGYSGRTKDCKIRLLAVNMPAKDFQSVTSRIPHNYLK